MIKNILYGLLFGVVFLLGFLYIKIPNDKLYDIYYEKQLLNYTRSINSDIIDINDKSYNDAIKILQNLIKNDKNSKMAHYYLGLIYQKEKNYNKAIEEYKWLINDNDNIFIEQSQWNIGLCYLKLNKNNEAEKYFEILAKNDGYYKLKAERIISFKTHIVINIIIFIIMIVFMIYFYHKQLIFERKTIKFNEFIENNNNIINNIYRKKEADEIKKTIQLYSQFQVISKVANCDYISYFKYDYTKENISINFVFTLHNNSILEDTLLYDLGNNISMDTLKFSSDDDLNFISVNDVKNINIYKSMKYKGTNKIYYKNIFKNSDNPVGFVAISYKDINYTISKGDKIEINRMIGKIKNYI